MKKIKVVWLCSLSNEKIRKHLNVKYSFIQRLLYFLFGRKLSLSDDSAIWNTNAINEFEKMDNIELHVVIPVRNLSDKFCEFEENSIFYHCFRDENSSLIDKIIRFIFTKNSSEFKLNRSRMRELINKIKPDIVHIIGAENPQYSLGLYEVPQNIPVVLQLQALLDSIKDKVDLSAKTNYYYKACIEKNLINRADYVATCAIPFIKHIRENINKHVTIINGTLAMAQKIDLSPCETSFDFVHFASCLSESKATDVALEAFFVASKQRPNITLNIIGGASNEFLTYLKSRVKEEGLQDYVQFEGRLKTHYDVVSQLRKSRFALLPLKVSLIPNTLHEVMANGLPLITTITPGTSFLNKNKQCALISPQGDYLDIAKNMLLLLNDEKLAKNLRKNAAEYEFNRNNNSDICMHWLELYKVCIANKKYGDVIPVQYLSN